jgi:Co/Zn/Cd efflux system component
LHHGGDEPTQDGIGSNIKAAIVVFACLGLVQVAVATSFHKVALGVDGAHNLVDSLVLAINLRARYWAKLDRYSALTCKLEPAAPLISSALVILSAIGFTAVEAISGGGSGSNDQVALGLLIVSLVANTWYAWRLHLQEHHDAHSRNAMVHLFADAATSLIAAVAYGIILLGGPSSLDPWAAWLSVAVVLLAHWNQISASAHEYLRHRDPNHKHSADHAH